MKQSCRWLFVAIVPSAIALTLGACSDSPRPYGDRKVAPGATPSNTAAPTADSPAAPPPATGSPVIPPSTATDVEQKTGTDTGMVGGASGTVGSGGKPGSGTSSGGGTGPAESSGEKTENRK